jgi:hypothetical protein
MSGLLSMTRVGKTVQKMLFPKPLFHGESNISKSKGLTMTKIFDVIDTMVHHALINHSRVLVNTLQRLIKQTMNGTVHQESHKGLWHFNTSGYNGAQTLPHTPQSVSKYYPIKDVDP